MTKDIKKQIGKDITKDTEKILTQFSSNFEVIDDNFVKLKQRIDVLESNLKQAITEAKDAQILGNYNIVNQLENMQIQA